MTKTEHLELPLYEGNDVVKYLTIYNETMEKIDTSVYDLQSALVSDSTDVSNLSDNLKAVKKDLGNAEIAIKELQEEIAKIQTKDEEQSEAIEELKENLIVANATIKEHATKFSEIESEISDLSSDLSEKITKVATNLRVFIDEQTTKNTKFTNDIRELKGRVTTLEGEIGKEPNYQIRVKSFNANESIEWDIDDITAPPSLSKSYGVLVLVEGKNDTSGTMSYGTPSGSVTNSDNDFTIEISRGGSASTAFTLKISGECTTPIMVVAFATNM